MLNDLEEKDCIPVFAVNNSESKSGFCIGVNKGEVKNHQEDTITFCIKKNDKRVATIIMTPNEAKNAAVALEYAAVLGKNVIKFLRRNKDEREDCYR